MRRTRAFVLVLIVAVGACIACQPQPPILRTPTPAHAPDRQDVVLFGDSLAAMAETTVMGPAHTADRTGESWSYNALGATRVQHWLAPMAMVDGDDTVIFELGTNNVTLEAINTGEIPTNLRAGLDALRPARCVVAFTLNTTGGDLRGFPYDTRTRWVNDELRRLVASGEYPNLVLFDWDAVSDGRVGWLVNPVPGGDYVHYGTVGNEAFAQAIVDSVDGCPSDA